VEDIIIEIPGSKYGEVIIIDEYGGVFGLALGRKGTDGKIYRNWVFPQNKDRKPTDKAIPLKIPFGSKEAAQEIVRQLAFEFGATKCDDGIPF